MGDSIARKKPIFTKADIDRVRAMLYTCGVREGLDDATGEVLLRVSERLDRHDPARPIGPWLNAFARFIALEHRRKQRALHEHEELCGELGDAGSPADLGAGIVAREQLAILDRLLDELEPEFAEVLVLCVGTHMTTEEVAAALGIPHGTVASRLARARAQLEAAYGRIEGEFALDKKRVRATLPPLWVLFERAQAGSVDTASPSIPAVSSALPHLAAAPGWLAAGLPALAACAALVVAAMTMPRCEAPSPEPHPVASAPSIPEGMLVPPSASPGSGGAVSASVPSAEPLLIVSAAAPPTNEISADEARAQLYAARTAFGRGDARGALAALERLDRRDRRGVLWGQRELLRIEVLAQLGRVAEARVRAVQLRKALPNEPTLKRLTKALDGAR